MEADLTLVAVKHKMDYPLKGNILEDKYFFVFKGENPRGDLFDKFEGGENTWLSQEEIKKLPDLFDGVEESMDVIEKNKFSFLETKYTISKY